MDVLVTDDLTRRFGSLTAVDHMNISLAQGEFFGLLGPNGAGKTTAIKMLITLLPPTSGTARVAGHDIRTEQGDVRRHIGYVPQLLSADGQLTGYENLLVFAKLYDVPRKEVRKRVEDALDFIGLKEAGDTPGIRGLSQALIIYLLAVLLSVHIRWNPLDILAVLVFMVLGAAIFSTLSLVIACIVRTRERFMGIGQLLTMPLFFASNALYPISLMPEWLQLIARGNPLSYMVDALRMLMLPGYTAEFLPALDFAAMFATLLVLVAIAQSCIRDWPDEGHLVRWKNQMLLRRPPPEDRKGFYQGTPASRIPAPVVQAHA